MPPGNPVAVPIDGCRVDSLTGTSPAVGKRIRDTLEEKGRGDVLLCDIIVKGAHYEVTVQALRELLFGNEIYQQRQQRPMSETANFLLLDCDVHSYADAVAFMKRNDPKLKEALGKALQPTLSNLGWQIVDVSVVAQETWQVTLQDQDGPARGDESLLQVLMF